MDFMIIRRRRHSLFKLNCLKDILKINTFYKYSLSLLFATSHNSLVLLLSSDISKSALCHPPAAIIIIIIGEVPRTPQCLKVKLLMMIVENQIKVNFNGGVQASCGHSSVNGLIYRSAGGVCDVCLARSIDRKLSRRAVREVLGVRKICGRREGGESRRQNEFSPKQTNEC